MSLSEKEGNVDKIVLPCRRHPDRDAFVTCTLCGAGICHDCLSSSSDSWELICPNCRLKKIRVDPLKLLGAFKYPFAWIFLCLLGAYIAYSAGFGNPGIVKYLKSDVGKPWFEQRAPLLYLREAEREMIRAEYLKSHGIAKEARVWFLMASKAFAKTRELWSSTPISDDLQIAEYSALSEAGKPAEALEKLESMRISQEKRHYAAWLFYKGLSLEKIGTEPDKAKQCFLDAARFADAGKYKKKDLIDALIDMSSNLSKEEIALATVYGICGTNLDPCEVRRKAGLDKKPEPPPPPETKEELKGPEAEMKDYDIEILE